MLDQVLPSPAYLRAPRAADTFLWTVSALRNELRADVKVDVAGATRSAGGEVNESALSLDLKCQVLQGCRMEVRSRSSPALANAFVSHERKKVARFLDITSLAAEPLQGPRRRKLQS